MKQETEIEKINRIMNKSDKASNLNISFSDIECLDAVSNWARNSGIEDFDISFIDNLSDWAITRGALTKGQKKALKNIVASYEINLEKWAI